ncbi:hypothetical protein CRG98_040388 [Punica granatum]|uniref:Uncharacterized protein n=1 Tax=Punica granatum TaxID=22663 RepID=A0A2I0I5C8_PUNGR|nr:hypothetical protein CRG98_040388 [Punica granatum]
MGFKRRFSERLGIGGSWLAWTTRGPYLDNNRGFGKHRFWAETSLRQYSLGPTLDHVSKARCRRLRVSSELMLVDEFLILLGYIRRRRIVSILMLAHAHLSRNRKRLRWHAGRPKGQLLKSGWRFAWSSCRMYGFSTTGTVLYKDGGSRLKGVNSLKSGGDLWGSTRLSNRATYPYSEPLSNLCFLISVVGRDPLVPKASMICNNFVSSGHACARLCNAAWECPPSWGRATDPREKESPLPVYDLKVEGR